LLVFTFVSFGPPRRSRHYYGPAGSL
jgi:hypothetical protein